MSYTDGKKAPKPTVSERVFAELTDEERDAITERWLRGEWHTMAKCPPYPEEVVVWGDISHE